MERRIDVDNLIDDYNDMKRMFKEIEHNAKSISKFIDKLINQSINK
jgi:hypothetical protein